MSNSYWRCLPFLLLLVLSGSLARPVFAQDDDQADPPDRVARLNYMQGSVSYQVSGDQDWVQADPNRPLTTGDNLWADQDSRGEVHIDSTAIRLSGNTGISFLTLDDRTAQIQLAQGTIEVHLRDLAPGEDYEFDTPNVALTLTRSGEYLISTDPDSDTTTVVVREGEAQVTGGGDSWTLPEGQEYVLSGTDQLGYDARPLPWFDDFEAWCQDRDQRENNSISARYVSRDVDGYYDLDHYGQWDSDADYGMVWYPTSVAAGWAPYRMGHWVYIEPWGWTWVDAEPWGFAPFHYGRWCFIRSRWAWVPGPRVVRPVYAPALVAFVGGAGWSVSVAFGGGMAGVAWFPLGPRDVYVPAYRCSPRYVENVNVTNTRVVNVTQVTNVYNNVVINRNVTNVNYTYARNERAVTVVQRDTFVNARPVSQGMLHVNAQQVERARVVESQPIAPARTSYVSATARISNARPSVPIARRPVVVRTTPAVANPNRGGNVYTNDSREFSRPTAPQGATPQAHQPIENNGNRPQQQPEQPGFRPFEPPAGGNRTQPPADENRTQRPPDGRNPNQPPPAYVPENRNQNQPQERNYNQNQPQERNYNQNASPNNDQVNRNNNPRTFRYAPPPQAHDNMYDVHPPLNRNQNRNENQPRTQPAPRQQPERSSPPARQQGHSEGRSKGNSQD
ncbi:MAG: FecR protein [Acidobacteriota bacterium]|nr:FecR protein [Acidobacteriota bacterium]